MAVDIVTLTKRLHETSLGLDEKKKADISEVTGVVTAFVEVIAVCIDRYGGKNSGLLHIVLDEIFSDAHVSIALAGGGHFKASSVILRAVVELGLYILYFLDHPVEAKIWAGSSEKPADCDMSFGVTLETVASYSYMSSASSKDIDENVINKAKADLQKFYRDMSERVHGKFRFLQSTSGDVDELLSSYRDTATSSIKSLIRLFKERLGEDVDVFEVVPCLRKVL